MPPASKALLRRVLEDLGDARARAATGARQYADHRLAVGAAQASRVRAAQELPPPAPRADPARWESCRLDLRRFSETYLASTFYLAWSPDHLKVIARLQEAVLAGGLFAFAMPRGGGKTSLAEAAALWAVLYGHRRYVALLAVSAARGQELIDHLKGLVGFRAEPEGPLTRDFTFELAAWLALEGEPRRCLGQRFGGKPTAVRWGSRRLVAGAVTGSLASGAVVSASGLTGGGVRGQRHRLTDSQEVSRPDLALVDDPQDDEVAASASQTRSRLKLLNGAVLGMAGPNRRIAALAAVTVIQPGDVASRLLDRTESPDWRGERMQMLYGEPREAKLWEEYRALRLRDLLCDGDPAASGRANCGGQSGAFYLARRAEMDAGLTAAWPARFDAAAGEASAVQAAMNLRFRDEETFLAEYQNDPLPPEARGPGRLRPDQVAARTSGHTRGAVPAAATKLTMFVDVHDALLFWMVAAWEENFSGHVVDYGTWPDQGIRRFALEGAGRTLARAYPGAGADGAIRRGLQELVASSLAREWDRGGGRARIDRLLVDMGYKPALVADVKRAAGGAAMMLSKGVGCRASRKPMAAWVRKPGEVHGHHWYIPTVRRTGEYPHVLVDVNWWKTFVAQGLAASPGDPGAIQLFGRDARAHDLLAEHLAESEWWVEVTGPWGTVREWSLLPGRPDNHWLDCLVGCAAAASMAGIQAPGQGRGPGPREGRARPKGPRKAEYL